MRTRLIVHFAVLLLLAVSRDGFSSGDEPINLNGHWKTDRGEEVVVKKEGTKLRAMFVSGADCPYGGTRSSLLDAEADDESIDGEMMVCTRVEKLVSDCGLDPVYTVDVRGTFDRRQITLKYKPDYVNYRTDNGRFTNCSVKRHGGTETTVTLTRIGCDAGEVAKAQELYDSYQATKELYEKAKHNLKPGQTFAEVQDWVLAQLREKTGKKVSVSGETGGEIRYRDPVTGRYQDPDSYSDPAPGQQDPRREWEVEIPSSTSEPTGYPIVDQVNADHEKGHADAMRQEFQDFKDGKTDWKTWEKHSTLTGGKKDIEGYIDNEIKHYEAGLKTLKDFLDKCRASSKSAK